MTSTIQKRLEKAEATIEAREPKRGIEWQMGYVQRLPPDYVGERHTAMVSRLPNGYYEWEERPGPGPVEGGDDSKILFRITFVKGRDGAEVPYKLGDAWRELESEDKEPAVSLGEPKAEAPSPDDGDAALARIRAILATPPPPPTQPRPKPSSASVVTPWSWA